MINLQIKKPALEPAQAPTIKPQEPIQASPQSEAPISSTLNSDILINLNELEKALLNDSPKLAECLRHIFKATLEDPSQVTIMTDEQRSIYFRGLTKQTNVELVSASLKKRTAKPKGTQISVDDLM